MEKLTNEITTQKIAERDNWRVKNYRESLRGYQVRQDILENMFRAIDIKELIGKKDKIIMADIGCGPGICGEFFTDEIKKEIKDEDKIKTLFIDINEQMLEQIPDKKEYLKIRGDITDIPLENESVDIVTVKQVLDYLPRNLQIKALSEINRILKNDGKFILSALISPHQKINELTNSLYSEREKIIAEKVAIEKFIPDENILLEGLEKAGFQKRKILYKYNIPLSTEDFKKSFNLSEEQRKKLKSLYEKIIKLDTNNDFQSKEIEDDIELTEKGIIIESEK